MALLAAGTGGELRAEGIPEPGAVLYGVIRNVGNGSDLRLTSGSLNWTFKPSTGGPAIIASGHLQNVNDQFSYVLQVPCETRIPGLPISSNALALGTSPVIYNCSQVSVEGEPAYFVQPTLTNLAVSVATRGQYYQVDLVLNSGGSDFASWALRVFGSANVDPNADADGDGVSNWAEYKAGTDARDPQSQFAFISIGTASTGGVEIKWASVPGKVYTIQRSSELLAGFVDLKTGEPASSSGLNVYHDLTATGVGPYFYKLRVD